MPESTHPPRLAFKNRSRHVLGSAVAVDPGGRNCYVPAFVLVGFTGVKATDASARTATLKLVELLDGWESASGPETVPPKT